MSRPRFERYTGVDERFGAAATPDGRTARAVDAAGPAAGAGGIAGLAARLAVAGGAVTLHPLLVHFPIGLIVTAAVIDVAALGTDPRSTLRRAATGLYLAGAATLIAAYFTGRSDAALVRIPGPAHAVVDEHWTWALRTTVYMGLLGVGRLGLEVAGLLTGRGRWLPVVAAGLVGVLLLFQTAERGGRLVYEHGVGVAAPRTR